MSDAIALTFSQTTGLARDDLFALLADFPVASQIVRKAALRMALARGLAKAAKTLKRADGRWGGVGGEGGFSLTEVFDRAMNEAAEQRQRPLLDQSLHRHALSRGSRTAG